MEINEVEFELKISEIARGGQNEKGTRGIRIRVFGGAMRLKDYSILFFGIQGKGKVQWVVIKTQKPSGKN